MRHWEEEKALSPEKTVVNEIFQNKNILELKRKGILKKQKPNKFFSLNSGY